MLHHPYLGGVCRAKTVSSVSAQPKINENDR